MIEPAGIYAPIYNHESHSDYHKPTFWWRICQGRNGGWGRVTEVRCATTFVRKQITLGNYFLTLKYVLYLEFRQKHLVLGWYFVHGIIGKTKANFDQFDAMTSFALLLPDALTNITHFTKTCIVVMQNATKKWFWS